MMRTSSVILICLTSFAPLAAAQGDAPADEPAADPAAPSPPPPAEPATSARLPPPPPPVAAPPAGGGATLRNGFSLSIGQELGTTASGAEISGQLYGVDWRIGAKLGRALSVYLNTHLSFGTASVGGGSGATGNFATALMGEYLLPARVYVAGGGGYGVLNNPSGPLLGLRAGWYPFEKTSAGKARRLNVGLDARYYFVDDAGTGVTVSHYALTLGYDRF